VFAASIGFATTLAEPSLLAVPGKRADFRWHNPGLGLRIAVSIVSLSALRWALIEL